MIEILDGELDLTKTHSLYSFYNNRSNDLFEVGVVTPNLAPTGYLRTGQVGYFLSNMKSIHDAHIGDTFYLEGDRNKITPFPGYEKPQ